MGDFLVAPPGQKFRGWSLDARNQARMAIAKAEEGYEARQETPLLRVDRRGDLLFQIGNYTLGIKLDECLRHVSPRSQDELIDALETVIARWRRRGAGITAEWKDRFLRDVAQTISARRGLALPFELEVPTSTAKCGYPQ